MPALSRLPLLVGLWVLLCALVVNAQQESTVEKLAEDPRFRAFLPSSFKISDTAFRSFEQLQEEFASFMSKLPQLWTSPRPVRHTPTAWRPTRETDNRDSARATTSGPCNSPFGQPVQAMVDPCGPSHECYAAEVRCEGAISNPENLLAKDAQDRNCTVRQVKCTNISSPIPQLPSESCTVRTLECPAQENVTLSQCKLRELVCDQALVRFADVNAAVCPSNSAPGLQCTDACTPMATDKTVCVCAMDRMGHTCNEWRPYSCNLTLLSPEPSCQSTIFDSDPICFLYSRQQKVPFNYSIQCSFTNTTGIKESVAHDSLFEYWGRRNQEFAISIEQQKLWPFDSELCVYDFNRLGNRNGCQNISLSPEQLCVYSPITFPVDFSKFTDNFFAGNRLYFEVGLTKASSFAGRFIKRDRRFIDFTDLHIPRSIDDSLSNVAISWIIVGVVCGSVCLLCTGFTIRQRIEKYKQKQRIKKLE